MKRDLSWLGSLSLSTGPKPTLNAEKFLMEKLGHPEQKTHFVHVAGTNGKGSVVEMMAGILQQAGYRVGKFLSPHLTHFNERIQVNGVEITDDELNELLDELEPLFEQYEQGYQTKITLFEVETTLALLYYAKQKCDVVVLEVGLGGTFDCTNIVEADVSVIVSIGFDHMRVLGETYAEIAAQKAGIIKRGGEVVCGRLPDEALAVVKQKCADEQANLYELGPVAAQLWNGAGVPGIEVLEYGRWGGLQVPLAGLKQADNVAICLECVEILRQKGWKIDNQAVRDGLRSVVHRGRFEVLHSRPTVIFDGAHNAPAIENLNETAEAYYPQTDKVFVVSVLKTKDVRRVLEALLRQDHGRRHGERTYIFTTGNNADRYNPGEELCCVAREIAPEGNYRVAEFDKAIKSLLAEYREATGFVVGSFCVYNDAVRGLNG